jgi:hypothetical protein
MYENQRRQQYNGLIFFLVVVVAINVWLGVRYASAPERSKQSLCAEQLGPSDLTCAVQSTWDKGTAGAWWGTVDGGLLFVGLVIRAAGKKKPTT